MYRVHPESEDKFGKLKANSDLELAGGEEQGGGDRSRSKKSQKDEKRRKWLTRSLGNPKRDAMLPYGTQLLNDSQPRKMRCVNCGNLENTTRSCVSNHEHLSSDNTCNNGIASSIWVNKRVERGSGMRQSRKINSRNVDGKFVNAIYFVR